LQDLINIKKRTCFNQNIETMVKRKTWMMWYRNGGWLYWGFRSMKWVKLQTAKIFQYSLLNEVLLLSSHTCELSSNTSFKSEYWDIFAICKLTHFIDLNSQYNRPPFLYHIIRVYLFTMASIFWWQNPPSSSHTSRKLSLKQSRCDSKVYFHKHSTIQRVKLLINICHRF
jgi:hypothetical protein